MSGIQQTLLGGSPAGGYQIERSLRFNSADSAYLNRTPASASNRTTWTYSVWLKRSSFAAFNRFLSDSSNNSYLRFNTSDALDWNFWNGTTSYTITTSQVFRDPSAWYHIIVAVDTTQATSSNRVKFYVNGSQITAFSSASYPAQNNTSNFNNNTAHYISSYGATAEYFNGYMTEINFIDGQALTPSDFGETDSATGVWKPKKFSGTYGSNGFFLSFSDNSNTTSTTLGKDYSGNGNNWSTSGFSVTAGVGNDSLVDTPTSYGVDTGVGGEVRGNYITFNQLLNGLNYNSGSSILNGNLQATTNSQLYKSAFLSMGITSGKWYCEFTWTAIGANAGAYVGVAQGIGEPQTVLRDATYPYIGSTANSYGYRSYDGQLQGPNDLTASYGNSYVTNDIIGVALDMDSGKVWFSKNGTWQNSGSPTGGTNAAKTGLTDIVFIGASYYDTNDSVYVNTGQRPFAYTAPSGFKALCTQNLPTPTIGATSTTQADDYFNIVLYTGNGGTSQSITGVGFQPDFVWIKKRSGAEQHELQDAVRGATKRLASNLTDAETTVPSSIVSFNSNGFTVGNAGSTGENGFTYVGWNWNAGGSNATNTSGTITSTVRANTTAGFSIVSYTGNGSNSTVGHGLGVAPSMIILKNRDDTDVWMVQHTSMGPTKYIILNRTDAEGTASTVWNNTAPTSSVFSIGTLADVNTNTEKYIAYCFAPVAGYSAFGSYTGNGSTDGPFVYTGFRPRYVMVKRTNSTGNWIVEDTSRSPYNQMDAYISANASSAEATGAYYVDYLSNGFKLRYADPYGDTNASGSTYIFAAFAENPFKYSLAR